MLGSPSHRHGNKPTELKEIAQGHPTPNWQMQPLSPGRWDPTVCPRSSCVLAGPGVLSCPKICPALQPNSPGGSRWSLQVPTAPLLLLSPDSGPSFCRAALRAPQSAGGHTCPVLAASPCSQLPRVGSAQVVRAHERRRKGVSLWSAPSCDLGPPSLSLTLPATCGSFPLCSSPTQLQVLL